LGYVLCVAFLEASVILEDAYDMDLAVTMTTSTTEERRWCCGGNIHVLTSM